MNKEFFNKKLNIIILLIVIIAVIGLVYFWTVEKKGLQTSIQQELRVSKPLLNDPANHNASFHTAYYGKLIEFYSKSARTSVCQKALRDYYSRQSQASVVQALRTIQADPKQCK